MSTNIRSSVPASSPVRAASAIRCARATAASWLAWPKLNSRSKIPTVEGAYTSSNTRGVPPARSTFASSMLSAPHIMPAMIVVSFPAGLTAPDLTRVLGRSTCSPINRERPACSASSSTGTKPAADTRFRSSNTADSELNVCDDCTGNAFRNRDDLDFDNRYCPSSGGIFAVHTPIIADRPSTDSGLELPVRRPAGDRSGQGRTVPGADGRRQQLRRCARQDDLATEPRDRCRGGRGARQRRRHLPPSVHMEPGLSGIHLRPVGIAGLGAVLDG